MTIPTILRAAEHAALKTLNLSGSILDLGGDGRSEYRKLIQGNHTFTTINLDEKAAPDILHDLEKPLPLANESYDHVLLINVLEHVYEYRQLLAESARVVRPGGAVVIVVPFLFPVHPSPNDFWRFTEEALRRECDVVNLSVKQVTVLGSGVFTARYVMLDRLLPFPVRLASLYTFRLFVKVIDSFLALLAKRVGKKYDPADYALGYVVHARK